MRDGSECAGSILHRQIAKPFRGKQMEGVMTSTILLRILPFSLANPVRNRHNRQSPHPVRFLDLPPSTGNEGALLA